MENLQIISTSITVQAKQEINGNTANFAWNYVEGDLPKAINFNVQRGIEGGEQPFIGNNVISGAYYPENGKFDVQNNSLQDGDFELYNSLLITCKGIVTDLQSN